MNEQIMYKLFLFLVKNKTLSILSNIKYFYETFFILVLFVHFCLRLRLRHQLRIFNEQLPPLNMFVYGALFI